MGRRRRPRHHRPRRDAPVSGRITSDERSGHRVGCILMHRDGGPVHQDAPYGSTHASSSALMVSRPASRAVRRTTSAPSPSRVTTRVPSRLPHRLGITTRDSTSIGASTIDFRLSNTPLGASRGAKSVFVMSQREVEMHNMESCIVPLIGRLACLSRRLRGRRNALSNGLKKR